MENSAKLLAKYNNLEKESEAVLVDFLKKCPDYSWNVNLRLGIHDGNIATCESMYLSLTQNLCFSFKDYKDCDGSSAIYASELMYGEMAKIIATLPNDVEFERYTKLQDFLHSNYNVAESLSEYPFFCENDGEVQITDIDRIDGVCRDLVDGVCVFLNGLEIGGGKITLRYPLEDKVVEDFIAHLEKSTMLCSEQYKTIKSFLDVQEGLSLDINDEVTMEYSGIKFNVDSLDTTDEKDFTIHGVVVDNDDRHFNIDALMLHPQDLDGLVDYIRKHLKDQFGAYVFNNLQKTFSYCTALKIYNDIINEVIDEMMTSRCWTVQSALDNVVLKRMSLA